MAENKTVKTAASVDSYLDAIEDESRRADCVALVKLMTKATKQKPAMWGENIVGFGSYHYKYESGREGDMCRVGFSSRKADISVYLTVDFVEKDALLQDLGKHKLSGSCLHIKRLSDIDANVLASLIAASYAEVGRRYG